MLVIDKIDDYYGDDIGDADDIADADSNGPAGLNDDDADHNHDHDGLSSIIGDQACATCMYDDGL